MLLKPAGYLCLCFRSCGDAGIPDHQEEGPAVSSGEDGRSWKCCCSADCGQRFRRLYSITTASALVQTLAGMNLPSGVPEMMPRPSQRAA